MSVSEEVQAQLAKQPDITIHVQIGDDINYVIKTNDNNGFFKNMNELKAKLKDVMTFLVKAEYNMNMAAVNWDGAMDLIHEMATKPPTFDILDNTDPSQIEPLEHEKEVEDG